MGYDYTMTWEERLLAYLPRFIVIGLLLIIKILENVLLFALLVVILLWPGILVVTMGSPLIRLDPWTLQTGIVWYPGVDYNTWAKIDAVAVSVSGWWLFLFLAAVGSIAIVEMANEIDETLPRREKK